jgi:glucose/arabinose dehydrogenase
MRSQSWRYFLPLAVLPTLSLASEACSGDAEVSTTSSAQTSTSSSSTSGPGGSGGSSNVGGAGGASTSGSGGGGGAGGTAPTIPTQADCSAPEGSIGKLKRTKLPFEFKAPLGLVSPWGDPSRVFVFERAGRIQLLKDGQKTTFLDIASKVGTSGEQGLLGLAFHPDYLKNGRFFVHYSASPNGKTTIEEYRRDPNDPNLASPMPVGEPILTVPQPAGNHNGGTIEFSPLDGFLYIGMGDGGGACDTYKTGQSLDTLLAKVLRIDVNTTPYSIPPGNVVGGRPEIYINGLRNPFRMGFDICSGELYIGDVGQGRREEIDVAPPGKSGLNYGWSVMEGSQCANGPGGCNVSCDQPVFDLPVHEYAHEKGRCSITGGRVYRGKAVPWLRGAYLYGDFCTGEVWSLRQTPGEPPQVVDLSPDLGSSPGQELVAFGEDEQGELYVVHLGGSIDRIEPEN